MSQKIYQASILVSTSLPETFSFTTNMENFPIWSGVKRIETIKRTTEVIGSQYRIISPTLLSETTVTIEITKYSPFIDWGFSYIPSIPLTCFNYHFESIAKGTKITLTYEQEISFLLNLISKITSTKSLGDLLVKLKTALESTKT